LGLQEAPFKAKARACVVLREASEGPFVAEEDVGEEVKEGAVVEVAVVEVEDVKEGHPKPICS
jgi:hypothetical protein